MKRIPRWLAVVLVFVIAIAPSIVHADVAPPAQPPGSNPGPETEGTQVRMVAEKVLIDVLSNTPSGSLGRAKVTADFTMRNMGSTAESMGVRFPISSDNGFGEFPEIKDLQIFVDNKSVTTHRISELDPGWSSDPVPWSEFNVNFPPNVDVSIRVIYTLEGMGEYPYVAFFYIFHTGAGWQGTIGSADLIVRLPYEANSYNVIFNDEIGWSSTAPGGVINGREVRWHFEDFEPDQGNDFQLSLVMPLAWQKVLDEQANIQKNPNDGEAWGRLGKAYKEILFYRRGFRSDDAGGKELYQLSIDAYEKAVTLKPDDALWHAGFADLLAVHSYYASQEDQNVQGDMVRSMQEIHRALELSPNDAKVNEIAEEVYSFFPDAIQQLESGYDFLWLTATPVSAAPTSLALEELTSTPQATTPPLSTSTAVPVGEASPTSEPPTARNPICGSFLFIPLALILFTRKKRRHSGL
jgi:hypothetical protein